MIKHLKNQLAFKPGLLLVILTLCISISATAILLQLLESLILHPFPMSEPERIVLASGLGSPVDEDTIHWWNRGQSFEALGLYRTGSMALQVGDGEEWIRATNVSPEFFQVFGIRPAAGRFFREEDRANPAVAVVSDRLARRRFELPAKAIGGTVRLNGRVYDVIGVLPPRFSFPGRTDVWTPMPYGSTSTDLLGGGDPVMVSSMYWVWHLRP